MDPRMVRKNDPDQVRARERLQEPPDVWSRILQSDRAMVWAARIGVASALALFILIGSH
jgi:hypothetical protein